MLVTLRKRVTRLENHIDTLIEKLYFLSQVFGDFNDLYWNASYYLGSSLYLYNNDRFSNRLFIWLYMTEKYSGCWS